MKLEPLTKEKIGYDELTPTFDKEDVRSAYLWALKDMKEIETGFGKGNEELRQLLLNVCKLHRNTLKKAFEAVAK